MWSKFSTWLLSRLDLARKKFGFMNSQSSAALKFWFRTVKIFQVKNRQFGTKFKTNKKSPAFLHKKFYRFLFYQTRNAQKLEKNTRLVKLDQTVLKLDLKKILVFQEEIAARLYVHVTCILIRNKRWFDCKVLVQSNGEVLPGRIKEMQKLLFQYIDFNTLQIQINKK